MDHKECKDRISLSVRRLREWQWLATLTEDPDVMLAQLRHEAREMIDFGRAHPGNAQSIGKLVVAYHRLMVAVKQAADRRQDTTVRQASLVQ